MDQNSLKTMAAAASSAGGDPIYIDDIFSTYVYTGSSSAQTINNGIDLSGEGGLVIFKNRNAGWNHTWIDTERGKTKSQYSDRNFADVTDSTAVTSFNSNGFTVGAGNSYTNLSSDADNQVAWTWRKQKQFFDIVTYTGAGGVQTVNHNLGSVPGCIMIKCTTSTTHWRVYHRKSHSTTPEDYMLQLNATNGSEDAVYWNDTAPTSTQFTLNDSDVNANGASYVAYLFAHDEQVFGEAGNTSVIKCDSFTCDGSGNATVNLGWEPQWWLWKKTSDSGGWGVYDSMRGVVTGSNDYYLTLNSSSAENNTDVLTFTPTGVKATLSAHANGTFAFIAVRRPDGYVSKERTATELFAMDTGNGNTSGPAFDSGFPVDWSLRRFPSGGTDTQQDWISYQRILGLGYLRANKTDAQASSSRAKWDLMTGMSHTDSSSIQAWMWRRGKTFDILCYTGTGSNQNIIHSLGVVPEMILIKGRTNTENWNVYHKGMNGGTEPEKYHMVLNTNDNQVTATNRWNDTAPTATQFTVGTHSNVNSSGVEYIAMLWSSLSGVSKLGHYDGSNSNLTIDLGFTPRLFLTKAYSGSNTTFWTMWDSLRGITGGGSATPRIFLNTNTEHTTTNDDVSTTGSGITIDTGPYYQNAANYSYIYYAHA